MAALNELDKKIMQAVSLNAELRDLEQAVMLKKGIIDDIVKDIMLTDLKFPKEGAFSLIDIMHKIRDMSGNLVAP